MKMKSASLFSIAAACTLGASLIHAQTLFVPNGTNGIGDNTSNGNVGIGTASPVQSLEVNGNGKMGSLELTGYGGYVGFNIYYNSGWKYRSSSTGGVVRFDSGGDFQFFTAPSGTGGGAASLGERLRITSDGYVGIGTSTPAAILSLKGFSPPVGSIWGASYNLLFHNGTIGDTGSYGQTWRWNAYREQDTGYTRYLDFSDRPNADEILMDGDIRLRTVEYTGAAGDVISFADRLVVKAGGNVGIGTTSPTEKLSVNGTIRAKEVVVETTGWADDVFAPGYALPSVDEIAAHIESEGHLPGVPSAAAISDKGIPVGEMQATLLRKIEELTLYVIAQQKQLKSLQQNNDALTKELASLRRTIPSAKSKK